MWLANQTRPDIANAVRAVARYANQPREVHRSTAISILEYVFCTSDFGIMLGDKVEKQTIPWQVCVLSMSLVLLTFANLRSRRDAALLTES